jgi:uncharacterized protein with FMN-binding domain
VRRVVTVIVVTIGGLGLLASFHTSPGVGTRSLARGRSALQPPAGGSPPTSSSGSTSRPTTTSPANETTVPASPGATQGTAAPATAAPTTAAPVSRTVVGPVVSNRYGDVQVEVVVKGGQLADVEALELPSDRERSRYINSIAGPDLRQEALQAGSANIDVITGATYTSQSYAQSLQSALDQAGLKS